MPRSLRSRRPETPDSAVDLRVALGPVELPNPIVTASGTYGHGVEVARQGDPGAIGAITAKSLLPEPWAGKPAPRLHMTAAGMVNAVGLQGPGIDAWLEHDLPALLAAGARVIASLWGRTIDDYELGAALLAGARDGLVAVEVNVSCPNLHRRSEMFAHMSARLRFNSSSESVTSPQTSSPVTRLFGPRCPRPCCTVTTCISCQFLRKVHAMPPCRAPSR